MKIDHLWSTPVAEVDLVLPEPMRLGLTSLLLRREAEADAHLRTPSHVQRFNERNNVKAATFYNLFLEAENLPERDFLIEFERLATGLFRNYLRSAYGLVEADELKLSGRCFGNVQFAGDRTFPHYHQGVDAELVHYLSLEPNSDPLVEQTRRQGSHALLLQDPRGTPSFPYWNKIHNIVPRQGLTVIHPSYVWHETNVWRGKSPRVCLVVNFKVQSHGNCEIEAPLRF